MIIFGKISSVFMSLSLLACLGCAVNVGNPHSPTDKDEDKPKNQAEGIYRNLHLSRLACSDSQKSPDDERIQIVFCRIEQDEKGKVDLSTNNSSFSVEQVKSPEGEADIETIAEPEESEWHVKLLIIGVSPAHAENVAKSATIIFEIEEAGQTKRIDKDLGINIDEVVPETGPADNNSDQVIDDALGLGLGPAPQESLNDLINNVIPIDSLRDPFPDVPLPDNAIPNNEPVPFQDGDEIDTTNNGEINPGRLTHLYVKGLDDKNCVRFEVLSSQQGNLRHTSGKAPHSFDLEEVLISNEGSKISIRIEAWDLEQEQNCSLKKCGDANSCEDRVITFSIK